LFGFGLNQGGQNSSGEEIPPQKKKNAPFGGGGYQGSEGHNQSANSANQFGSGMQKGSDN